MRKIADFRPLRFPVGHRLIPVITVMMLTFSLLPVVHAQEAAIVVTPINDRFYMISSDEPGASTVLLYVGEDGVLLVDSHFSFNTPAIQDAIGEITDLPLRYVINTHWHPDHVDGNAGLRQDGTVIFAHETVRSRMAAGQTIELFQAQVAPYPEAALPDVTFDNRITLYVAGQEIQVIHSLPAHTDGDAVVFFPQANIIHMGDIYLTNNYPFIDWSSGGGMDGYLEMFDQVLGMVDDSTVIVPGHGQLSSTEELRAYRDMFTTVQSRVQASVDAGKTLDEILAESPTAEFDALYNNPPLTSEVFISALFNIMSQQ